MVFLHNSLEKSATYIEALMSVSLPEGRRVVRVKGDERERDVSKY